MNRIYRLVWNHALRVLQVASEFAHSHGGGASGERRQPAQRTHSLLAAAISLALALMAQPALAATTTGLLVGNGGIGDTTGHVAGGSGGIGGGGGGIGTTATTGSGGGGGGFGGGGGGGGSPSALGGAGGSSIGGAAGSTSVGGGGDVGGTIGGDGATASAGSDAGSGIPSIDQVASIYALPGASAYDFVAIGGGGGGSSQNTPLTGGSGELDVGGGLSLTVHSGLLVGGGGGGAGGPNTFGFGGAGGAGTLVVSADSSVAATGIFQVGGGGGGGGYHAGDAGNGGSGTVTIADGSTASVTGNLRIGGAGGGGGGGGSVNNSQGGYGGSGAFAVDDAAISVTGTLQLGGDGGNGGSGGSGGAAGNGGSGGSGTLTLKNTATANVNQLVLGGDAGTSIADTSLGGTGGTGGAGVLNLGGGSTLAFTGGAPGFVIHANGSFNLGNATVNGTTSGTITGLADVTNDGTINFNQSDTSTFSANIAGSGSVHQNSNSTTILVGANSYTGGTVISGGTLQVGNGTVDGTLGTGSITDNAALVFDNVTATTFQHNLSGTGTVTQQGTGNLTYSGISTGVAWRAAAGSTLQVGNGLTTSSITSGLGNTGTSNNGAMGLGSPSMGGMGGNGTTAGAGGTGATSSAAVTGYGGTILTVAAGGGTVTGGTGGTGGKAYGGTGGAGGAGGGGAAVGGVGGNGGTGGSGGAGGSGSTGVSGTGFSLTNAGSIVGGGGGTGGNANGGSGGSGGNTFSLSTFGGNGGNGGNGGTGGTGGTGGNGVSGNHFTLTNTGSITGGNGGVGGSALGGNAGYAGFAGPGYSGSNGNAGNNGTSGDSGSGGVGLVSTGGSTVVNAGAIHGGTGKNGQVDAVNFSGGGNTLTLESGYGFTGNVVSSSSDTLALGGDTSPGTAFDLSQIVTAAPASWTGTVQYAGFANLAKTGNSTWIVTGSTGSSAPWTISSGTLQVGDGSTDGMIGSGDITDNAALVFDNAGSAAVAGDITGTGTLTQQGSGTLTLTGANSYSGGTTISAGTLVVNASSLPGDVVDNATLVFDQASDDSFSGAISGNGQLTKAGNGLLILDGDSSAFAGTTAVTAGTLEVGDAAMPSATLGGDVTVNAGGTLRGHGTIGGNVSNNGIVWPGGSIGTLTVNGNYAQTTDGVLKVDAMPDGQVSLLAVTGTATLAGSALVLTDTGAWAPQTDYTILTAGGGVSGKFSAVSTNLAFLTPTVDYDADGVTLSLQRNEADFASVAQTSNQRAVATAANPLGFGNPVYDALVMLDAATARHAFDQLSGEIHASTRTAIADNDHYLRDAINQHLAGQNNNANGLNVTDADGVTAWTATWGHWGSHDGNGNAATLKDNGSGLLVGVDMPVGGDARLGAIIGTGQGTARVDTLGSSSHIIDQHLGIYGNVQTGALQWQGGAIYGWQKADTHRFIDFGTFSGSAVSNYRAHTTQAYVDVGLPIVRGNATLTPFANLAMERLSTPAIRENGTPAALDVAAQDSTLGYGTLGLRAVIDLGPPDHGTHAHASLGWQHVWGDVSPINTMRFASGGDSFTVTGLPVLRNAGVVNAGISFTIAPNVSVDGSYQGQFGEHAKDQSARLSLDWRF